MEGNGGKCMRERWVPSLFVSCFLVNKGTRYVGPGLRPTGGPCGDWGVQTAWLLLWLRVWSPPGPPQPHSSPSGSGIGM